MDNANGVKNSKRVVNILFVSSLIIVGIFVAGLLYLESLSPGMLFVNDTERTVSNGLIGGTSPSVSVHVAPGESQFIDMPSWWGTPSFPREEDGTQVDPRWNFIIFEVYYLSDFPESW